MSSVNNTSIEKYYTVLKSWWSNMNKQDNDDDWYKDLANAAKLLFEANETALKQLGEDWKDSKDSMMWKRLANDTLSSKDITFENVTTIIDKLKKYATNTNVHDYPKIQKLDFEDIKVKSGMLKGILNEVTSIQNGDKRLTFKLELKTGRENEAWSVILIAYIQSMYNEQTDKDFAREFIEQTKCLSVNKDTSSSNQQGNQREVNEVNKQKIHISTQKDLAQSENKTLILVFGQSYWDGIRDIENKTMFNDSDYELLKKYEWFWYGLSGTNSLAEISNDQQGNMCWLQLDVKLNNMLEVKNRLHFIELIDKIKKLQVTEIQMKVGGLFQLATSGLSSKGFIKA
jgi:hypothetical protein